MGRVYGTLNQVHCSSMHHHAGHAQQPHHRLARMPSHGLDSEEDEELSEAASVGGGTLTMIPSSHAMQSSISSAGLVEVETMPQELHAKMTRLFRVHLPVVWSFFAVSIVSTSRACLSQHLVIGSLTFHVL
mmetsp:Transcript_19280/g.55968  ORF Transcript_19280/g.55968 Transcript_19280/m.55968 type:complete len:131 (+) Transcript_19280:8-400(+)